MSYSIIRADIEEHREVIISLWKKNYQGVSEERYPWIYDNNPYGPPTCYLLQYNSSNNIVGAITLFDRTMVINGENFRAYICGDLVVDRNHRALGPALSLLKAAVSKCDGNASSILIAFPNKKSEPVTLRAGFEVLGDNLEMTRVVKTYPYIRRYIKFPLLARTLSCPLDLLLQLRYMQFFKNNSSSYICEINASFDERFDDLWDKTKNKFDFIGERSSLYLNWRIKESPYNNFQIFTLSSEKSKELIGYIAFCVTNRRVNIIDLAFEGDGKVFNSLISLFAKHHKFNGIESMAVNIAGNSPIIDLLKKRGFSIRSRKNKVIIYASSEQKEIISEIRNGEWYLTAVDNDI